MQKLLLLLEQAWSVIRKKPKMMELHYPADKDGNIHFDDNTVVPVSALRESLLKSAREGMELTYFPLPEPTINFPDILEKHRQFIIEAMAIPPDMWEDSYPRGAVASTYRTITALNETHDPDVELSPFARLWMAQYMEYLIDQAVLRGKRNER